MKMKFLNDSEKWRLAVFLKRTTFNAVYEVMDSGSPEAMKEETYRTLEVIEKMQKELANMGFAPR